MLQTAELRNAARLYVHRCGFLVRPQRWSIGIYTGDSIGDLGEPEGVRNPVLKATDVTDIPAKFVADPFLFRRDGRWHLFFEALNADNRRGEIGLATSDDGLRWRYESIVLKEPFHLSYPYVFESDGAVYMIPESVNDGSVRLYRAEAFPRRWSLVGKLFDRPVELVDPSVFAFGGRWWMFAAGMPSPWGTLRLYHAEALAGPWHEHPKSPLIADDPRIARPGGRVVVDRGRIWRFAQDDELNYGDRVRMFEVTRLTTREYAERPVEDGPTLCASGKGWNADGMHHIDAHRLADGRWLAAVDGVARPSKTYEWLATSWHAARRQAG